jgi:hypothetical protein
MWQLWRRVDEDVDRIATARKIYSRAPGYRLRCVVSVS